MQAWLDCISASSLFDIVVKALVAAATRLGSGWTSPGGNSPARSRAGLTLHRFWAQGLGTGAAVEPRVSANLLRAADTAAIDLPVGSRVDLQVGSKAIILATEERPRLDWVAAGEGHASALEAGDGDF